jgi:hypothetical protein
VHCEDTLHAFREEHVQNQRDCHMLSLHWYLITTEYRSETQEWGWSYGIKLKEGYENLNVDVVFSVEYFSGGNGVVIHDDHCVFIVGSCWIPHVGDGVTTWARVLGDGLILARKIRCTQIDVNNNYMEVTEVMQEAGNSIGPAVVIYEDYAFFVSRFCPCSFQL